MLKAFARSLQLNKSHRRRSGFRAQIQLVRLEDRITPDAYFVSSVGDNLGIDPAPGEGKQTLRQAIVDANVSFDCDNGKSYVSSDAFNGPPPELSKDGIKVTFHGSFKEV